MIKINSKILIQVLAQIRRCLALQPGSFSVVTIETTLDATTVRVTTQDASLTCLIPRGGRPESISVPFRTFRPIKPYGRHDVELNEAYYRVYIRYWEAGRQTEMSVEAAVSEAAPPEAEWLTSNDRSFGKTLFQAAKCTDGDSSRYSLGCLRLRGADGQIAATDGRQAFTAGGFTLPSGELLIPAEPLGKLELLTSCSGISVGRSREWLTLMVAVPPLHWRIDLRINSKSRFPNVDRCMPSLDASRYELNVHDADALYLLRNENKLFGNYEQPDCVTLDLEKSVTGNRVSLRARVGENQQYRLAELELTRSTFSGGPIRVAFDSRYLLSALNLGFRNFHIQSASGTPIFCSEGRRRFVWAAMHESMILMPSAKQVELSTLSQLTHA